MRGISKGQAANKRVSVDGEKKGGRRAHVVPLSVLSVSVKADSDLKQKRMKESTEKAYNELKLQSVERKGRSLILETSLDHLPVVLLDDGLDPEFLRPLSRPILRLDTVLSLVSLDGEGSFGLRGYSL